MSQVEHQAVSPGRVKRRRTMLWNLAGLAVAVAAIIGALVFWAGTASFARMVRRNIVARLESATGGRVEMQDFRWSVLDLAAEARGVVIHGTEEPGQAP
jgi:translocation and assembly module TamB